MAQVVIKAGKEKKLRNLYPWVYREEIENVEGEAKAGDLVELQDARGEFIARAFYNPASHIPARIVTFDPREKVGIEFFRTRVAAAQRRREEAVGNTNAYRVVHAEADGLPGLIVDRLGEVLVVQIRNAGMENHRELIVRALKSELAPRGIFERSDVDAREEEGLAPRSELLWGEVPEAFVIHEDDVEFRVSVRGGQKTGFYLDQRDNRRLLRTLTSANDRVLDVYAYTGGFGLQAAKQGARVLCVDLDTDALRTLEENAARNGVKGRVGVRWGDAIEVMKNLAEEKKSFTRIVLDPPTLARHKEDLPRVKRLFVEMVTSALALLERDGILFLSTCAYHMSLNDLIEVARIGGSETRRGARVLTVTFQPADHPWILQVPETLYLKTLVLRVE